MSDSRFVINGTQIAAIIRCFRHNLDTGWGINSTRPFGHRRWPRHILGRFCSPDSSFDSVRVGYENAFHTKAHGTYDQTNST